MKTRVLRVNTEKIEKDKILEAAGVLRQGRVIAYPTETFYGLGADCTSGQAVRKVYELKGREGSKPLLIVISEVDSIYDVAKDIPSHFWDLAHVFWPGPLTMVLKASSKLPEELLGPGATVGIRQPGSRWVRALIDVSGFPLTATSANISGTQEHIRADEVLQVFKGRISLVVDGGKTRGGLPSTVLSLASSKPAILREGAVPVSELAKYLT